MNRVYSLGAGTYKEQSDGKIDVKNFYKFLELINIGSLLLINELLFTFETLLAFM